MLVIHSTSLTDLDTLPGERGVVIVAFAADAVLAVATFERVVAGLTAIFTNAFQTLAATVEDLVAFCSSPA